jgi:hypothetical protein
MRIQLTTFALCLAGVTAHAQSTNDNMSGLESCIQAARVADAVCAKDDSAQHGDCFAKARSAQLECLDRVLSGAPAQSAPPASSAETVRPEPPVEAKSPEASPEPPASRQTSRTDQPDSPAGSTPADEAAKLSNAAPEPAPANVPPSAAEMPTGAIRSNSSDNRNDKPAQEKDWILSETTSPVDYSPLVTAVISATSDVKDGPNTLSVRCRARHTEISIRTDRAWGVSRGNDLLVDYQINDRPVVRQPWSLSTDGKTATYRYDPVELLRSIPEDATLKIAVTARGNVRLAATFALTGLSGIRQKVGTACQWAPSTAKASSEKR